MFDTIGVVDDPDGHRRKALSSVLTGLAVGVLLTLTLVGTGELHPMPPVEHFPAELSLVYLEVEEQVKAPVAPSLRHATRPATDHVRQQPSSSRTPPRDAPPTGSDEPLGSVDEDPAVTPELERPSVVLLTDAPWLDPDGRGGPGRSPRHEDSASATVMARLPEVGFESLHIRRQIKPRYPPSESGAVTCKAVVRIDASGSPSLVQVSRCPALFAVATRRAMRKWRWQRPEVDGVNRAVESTYEILFLPEQI